MRCKSCMWFVPKQAADGITDLGRCRRHAPTGMGFPPVFVNDWCGDHRLDENRVAQGYGRMPASEMERMFAAWSAKPNPSPDGTTNRPGEAQP